jgi:glycosyltransferase involved in cell wall biosynthesis
MHLLDPIYDPGTLRALRDGARLYVHGHSAGGTNPSLVEAMHFGAAPLAYDCAFNRYTTHDQAVYFKSAEQLRIAMANLSGEEARKIGDKMRAIASEHYTWGRIGEAYFSLLVSPRAEKIERAENAFRSEKETRENVH